MYGNDGILGHPLFHPIRLDVVIMKFELLRAPDEVISTWGYGMELE
jgi:hypothetical protein